MDLPTIWFLIIAFLFAGYFFLEGFDFGVGILLLFLSQDQKEREMMASSIGPFWDGNEVWLITAGAAMFAAFPNWYATLFSGFFMIFVLMLLALIARGIGLKFMKQKGGIPSFVWAQLTCAGSLSAAFLWGVIVANLLRGVPINAQMVYTGGTIALFNPYALVTGATFVLLFAFHGAVFLSLKTSGQILEKVRSRLLRFFIPALLASVIFLVYSYFEVAILKNVAVTSLIGIAVMSLLASGAFLKRSTLAAFFLSGMTILAVTFAAFAFLYPRVLISTLDPRWSLTIHNACSSPYSLKIQTFVALLFTPLVLLYQGWTYWILRKRITRQDAGY